MDWVYYHDVLARFTLRHWRGEATRLPLSLTSVWTEVYTQLPGKIHSIVEDQLSFKVPAISALLELFSTFCNTVMERPLNSVYSQDSDFDETSLKIFDWRIRTIPVSAIPNQTPDTIAVVELYRLAILIYINRVTRNRVDQSTRVQQQIDSAFTFLSRLNSCERQFPLFILGCEARTDEQRAMILDLISRTENTIYSRSLNYVKILIRKIWTQDDLADRELDYWDKLTSIISCCSVVPSFV
jgi:hypothetical protein